MSDHYAYQDTRPSCAHAYVMPAVLELLAEVSPPTDRRIFDLGCGNGAAAALLTDRGYAVSGVDPSATGIAEANRVWPHLNLHIGSGYDDLRARFGTFPVVISLEVIEHVYSPRKFVSGMSDLLAPGGAAILSTPYHGYLDLALAASGGMDRHFTALWDHGHIKFWSMATLGELLGEAGFTDIRFLRVGRVPLLAKSMVAIARRP